MKIRSSNEFGRDNSRYTASSAEDTLRELEEQYAAGEIEQHAYRLKKRSLVRLYLRSTTKG